MATKYILKFDLGTIVADELPSGLDSNIHFQFDERTKEYRAKACHYRDIILDYNENSIPYEDKASHYRKLELSLSKEIVPRKHQAEALKSWKENQQGVVVLPTGGGKTILAVLAMNLIKRSTLIIVPTIDLMNQWAEVLSQFFDMKIGMLGGGEKLYEPIMVSTYDSARLMIETRGADFGFLVVDECHHLPSEQNRFLAEACIAPFRLGLSATVERQDGAEELLYDLIGPKVYEARITDMVSKVLAPYDVVRISVCLTEKEAKEYHDCRQLYTNFLRQNRISFNQPGAWQYFIMKSNQSPHGRKAFEAYQRQKKIPQWAEEKFKALWQILNEHSHESLIIFTDDNQVAYRIAHMFFLSVITHKTKAKERKNLLDLFRSGKLKVLVTSRVLNEGVDVPEASIGVVFQELELYGSMSKGLEEFLRNTPGKRAILYEMVTSDTNEQYVNERRRQHHAYQESP